MEKSCKKVENAKGSLENASKWKDMWSSNWGKMIFIAVLIFALSFFVIIVSAATFLV